MCMCVCVSVQWKGIALPGRTVELINVTTTAIGNSREFAASLVSYLCPVCAVSSRGWLANISIIFSFCQWNVWQALPPKISVDLAKTFINLIPRKCTHTRTQIQSKMRALFMATEIFYSPCEIVKCLTYICPVFQGNDKKNIRGSAKKNANKIINLLKCSRSSSSSPCSGSSSSSKAKIHFHVRAMEFTCKFKKPEHSALSHTHTQTHIHIDRQTCICRQCVSVWHIWHIAASVLQRHFWFCWNIKMDGTHTYTHIQLHMAGWVQKKESMKNTYF